MAGRLGAGQYEIADIGIADDVADHFFNSDIFGLHGPRQCCTGLYPYPHQCLDVLRDLVFVVYQHHHNRYGRKIVASQEAAFLGGIIG